MEFKKGHYYRKEYKSGRVVIFQFIRQSIASGNNYAFGMTISVQKNLAHNPNLKWFKVGGKDFFYIYPKGSITEVPKDELPIYLLSSGL